MMSSEYSNFEFRQLQRNLKTLLQLAQQVVQFFELLLFYKHETDLLMEEKQ